MCLKISIKKFKPAWKTTVTVAEMPHQKFVADVTRVPGGLDATSRTMQAEIRINNAAGLLKPGMFAYIDFLLKKDNSKNAPLLIPASSLFVKPEGLFVAAVNPHSSVHFARS
ncbi:MAG: efflux RND transporter periplasmic adaptor subunit [Leptolyngbya sp.]|nr:efflux RND transporter periplasmic adaptor subunit [Candidatus Melainabacteria bacterium]